MIINLTEEVIKKYKNYKAMLRQIHGRINTDTETALEYSKAAAKKN